MFSSMSVERRTISDSFLLQHYNSCCLEECGQMSWARLTATITIIKHILHLFTSTYCFNLQSYVMKSHKFLHVAFPWATRISKIFIAKLQNIYQFFDLRLFPKHFILLICVQASFHHIKMTKTLWSGLEVGSDCLILHVSFNTNIIFFTIIFI